MAASIQRRVSVTVTCNLLPRVAHAYNARIPKSFTYVSHSFGEINLMVLKHTPLGEINLPFVASSANAPRCRRNRRSFDFSPYGRRPSVRVGKELGNYRVVFRV